MTNIYGFFMGGGFRKGNGPLAAHAVPLPGRGTVGRGCWATLCLLLPAPRPV